MELLTFTQRVVFEAPADLTSTLKKGNQCR